MGSWINTFCGQFINY